MFWILLACTGAAPAPIVLSLEPLELAERLSEEGMERWGVESLSCGWGEMVWF
jgi:hypothetical protein